MRQIRPTDPTEVDHEKTDPTEVDHKVELSPNTRARVADKAGFPSSGSVAA